MAVSASVATCNQCKPVTCIYNVERGDLWRDNLPGRKGVRLALKRNLLVCRKSVLKVSISQMLIDQVLLWHAIPFMMT